MKYFLAIVLLMAILCSSCTAKGESISLSYEYNMENIIAIYQEYNGVWYEFRYDWDRQATPQDWESVDELRAWLEYDDAPLILIADENGFINFNGQCEDEAFQARDRAYDVGKRLDTETLTRQECIKYRKYLPSNVYSLGVNDGHYLNKAVVGNEVWFVQSDTDKIWLVYYLD